MFIWIAIPKNHPWTGQKQLVKNQNKKFEMEIFM